jgi:hypothetical protein
MALVKSNAPAQLIGVALFVPPAWRQAYYWAPGMPDANFCDSPKNLANDRVWLTNMPYDAWVKNGRMPYLKHNRFFRMAFQRFVHETGIIEKTLTEQAYLLGRLFSRLEGCQEREHLYNAETMSVAMMGTLPLVTTPDIAWQQLGQEARSWYWKGSEKNKLLLGGALYVPRYEQARQIIKAPVPNFSIEPKIIKGEFKGLVLENLLKEHAGFVRLRIENVHRSVQDFADMSRTLVTTSEALWWMKRADVTSKYLYLTDYVQHPADNDRLDWFKPFSWLDGVRLECMALAPGFKNVAMEAHLRALANLSMAYYAEYLSTNKGIAPLALTYGKLAIAFNRRDEPSIRSLARESGMSFARAEEEGNDLVMKAV